MYFSTELWHKRLESEYKAMCCFPVNRLFSWRVEPGQRPPRVRTYRVTYHVKTLVKHGTRMVPQYKTEVLITLPDSPSLRPTARIVGGEPPWHPNVYVDARICIGRFWDEPHVWRLVLKIGKLLAFDPETADVTSAANPAALADFTANVALCRGSQPDFPTPIEY